MSVNYIETYNDSGFYEYGCAEDELMDSVFSENDYKMLLLEKQVELLVGQLNTYKSHHAWMESEKMKNSKLIGDYEKKFVEMKILQEELMRVVKQQSQTIRELKGYKKTRAHNVPTSEKKREGVISFWMALPIFGMLGTAIVEICRLHEISNLTEFVHGLGF